MGGAAGDGDHASSWLTLHQDVHAPASTLLARDVAWAVVSVTGAFYAWALVPMLQRYLELRRSREHQQGSRRSIAFQKKVVGWMLVNIGFNVMQQVSNSIMFGVAAAGRSSTFCQFAQKHSAVVFGGAMLGNYMVLVVRARTTSASAGRLLQLLQRVTEAVALAGLPIIMLVSIFLFRGRVVFGSICTQELPTAVAFAFTLADSGLSLMLLMLFVLPVLHHLRSVAASGASSAKTERDAHKMRRIAVKNMRLSAVQVVSTFVVQVIGAVSQTAFSDEHDPDLSFWRLVRFALYAVDLWVNSVTLMMMSNAWVPESWSRLRAFLDRYLEDDKGATSHADTNASGKVADNSSVMLVATSALFADPAGDGMASSNAKPSRVSASNNASVNSSGMLVATSVLMADEKL